GDYILQPGSLTTTTLSGSYSVEYPTLSTQTGTYAIIYRGTINNESYIGVSIDNDGNPSTSFNMKLSFKAADVPSGNKTLTIGSDGFVINVNGSSVVGGDNSLILNFGSLNTTDNTITITGGADKTINVGGSDLVINTIKAYYYNTSQ
ncbi:MAG TPA: hypothetical protein PKY31_17035, partial [Spirochaetota bacterium]|nr:hypothetical protein [Spirochaetota bacterium]